MRKREAGSQCHRQTSKSPFPHTFAFLDLFIKEIITCQKVEYIPTVLMCSPGICLCLYMHECVYVWRCACFCVEVKGQLCEVMCPFHVSSGAFRASDGDLVYCAISPALPFFSLPLFTYLLCVSVMCVSMCVCVYVRGQLMGVSSH